MNLSRAKICISCEEIFEEGSTCPRCGEESFAFLEKWLNHVAMVRRCAWCRELLEVPDSVMVSDGICPSCAALHFPKPERRAERRV